MEEWKEIEGYGGKYQVSSEGRVKSCYRITNAHGQIFKQAENKILKNYDNGKGYRFIRLGVKRQAYYIHRLVATTFLENPKNLPCINHLDYNRANNSVTNLEWVTYKENNDYSKENRIKGLKEHHEKHNSK